MAEQKTNWIKTIYLYLVSFVALFMLVFSVADMVNIVLKTWVFTKADADIYYAYGPTCPLVPGTTSTKADPYCVDKETQERQNKDNREAQKQRDLVRDISFLIVGLPLFAYHWMIIRRKEI